MFIILSNAKIYLILWKRIMVKENTMGKGEQ